MRETQRVIKFIGTAVSAAGAIDGKRTEYRIQDTRGRPMDRLVLCVLPSPETQPGGAGKSRPAKRVWRVHYEVRVDGKRVWRKPKIGDGQTALSLVSERWKEIKDAADVGRDWVAEKEAEQKQAEKEQRERLTFRGLAELYMEKHSKLKKRTWKADQNVLDKRVLPEIGDMPANEVSKDDVISIVETHATYKRKVRRAVDGVVKTVEMTGAPAQADRTKRLISSIYNWGQDESLVDINPAHHIRARYERKRRTKTLEEVELRKLWGYLAQEKGEATQKNARVIIMLTLLLGQRRRQISAARKTEIEGLHTGRPIWHIPKSRNKNKEAVHMVPLPPLAAKLFAEAIERAGEGSHFVFPSQVSRDKPIHADTVTDEFAAAREKLGLKSVTLHENRHTFKTALSKLGGVSKEIRDRITSHISAVSNMSEWYDHYDYDEPKREALGRWERRLLEIVDGAIYVDMDDEKDGGS